MNPVTAPATIVPTTTKSKDLRKKFGVRAAALVVSPRATAYKRPMNASELFTGVESPMSWVVIDPELHHPQFPTQGTVVRANTYDSNLGTKADMMNPNSCRELPADEREKNRVLKGYVECPVGEVPFVVVVE